MQKLEQGSYSDQAIKDQLHFKYGTNLMKFRYDILDKFEQKKFTSLNVLSGEVKMSAFAEIKRTARFTIQEGEDINWMSDRIQPFCMLRMPDGGWAEWSLGIFLLSSPKRKEQVKVTREIEAYDGLVVLKDDKFSSRYIITNGSNYIQKITEIMQGAGITKNNLEPCISVLNRDIEFEVGTSKLEAINKLLQEINYTSLWVDEWGSYTSGKYRSPADRAIEYTYKDNEISPLYVGVEEELDLFNIPNKWVVVSSNAESAPLTSIYTNSNALSPTSTVNRGRTIMAEPISLDNIVSQSALDDYTKRIAFNTSQVYGKLVFDTVIMPMHNYSDVLQIEYSPLSIIGKYSETGWTLPLKCGAKMRHEVRKVVVI